MGFENVALVAFNRGLISRLALARTDIKRVALSADTMVNWMPRVLGSMMLRPGLQYLGAIPAAPRFIPFVFSTDDKALVEFTASAMRIWIGDTPLTRVAVTGGIANGNFTADVSSWTDDDEAGGTSAWVTGGYLGLTGNGSAAAIRTQAVNIPAGDIVKEHALRIVIERGPVTLRVGSTNGGDELIAETDLESGVHSLAFTPGAAVIYVRFLSRLKRQVLVDSCNFESAGVVSLPSPFAASDLGKIRAGTDSQSASVIFIACYGYQQRVIERRATRSWSLVRYRVEDGPLRLENTGPITLTPSALSGNITVTASASYFKSTNAPSTNNDGSIFRISSNGQNVTATATAQNTFTNAITVEGVDNQRVFTITLSGLSGTGSTVTLQRSLVSDSGPWTDVQNHTTDTTVTFDDALDNQIAYYRIGVKTGNYVAGTIVMTLAYTVGSIDGYVRVTGYTSSTVVSAEVLIDLGGTSATDDWAEGEWSDRRGWPSADSLAEGRLWWTGKQGVWGSISDSFYSHDEFFEGDAGPINRDVGSGPLDNMNWMLPLARLVIGAQGGEYSCKSSSLDEPLTPTNFQIKEDSTQGSAAVQAMKVDDEGVFVQRGGTRVFNLNRNKDNVDYIAEDLTVLCPEVCEPGISRFAVQRQPDTRLHFVLSDGTAAVAIRDRAENVLCWIKIETRSGDAIEDVVVIPGDDGTGEDAVYYAVRRSVNGSTVRHLEKWALESNCRGSTLNRQADAFVVYTASNVSGSTISGFDHLIGESVVVWDNGKCLRTAGGDIATFTVNASGQITVTNAGAAYVPTTGVVGLAYRARWRSTKLTYAAQMGTALNQRKKIDHLGVILADTHFQGLKYGPDFDNMQTMPLVEDGANLAQDTVHSAYDEDPFEFPGEWGPDSRLCLEANAPRPVNILAATIALEERSKR